jgi:hypothetical protein
MQRRDFLGVLGGVAAWPLVARAQQPAAQPLIGFVSTRSPDEAAIHTNAFRRGADLRLTNADGGAGWFARVTDRGSELRLSDAKGKIRWSVSVDDDGAHVRTFDAAGKELATQK